MKKAILIGATATVLFSLAACSNQSSKKASSSSKVTSSKVAKHHKNSYHKAKPISSKSGTAVSSSQDLSDPRVQNLIQKGLLNPDGTPTRKGRDLNAMVEGENLPQSDWDSSDYTEGYDDEHSAYQVPIYGNQQSSSNPAQGNSIAPGQSPSTMP